MAGDNYSVVTPWLKSQLTQDFGLNNAQASGVVGALAPETGNFTQMQEQAPVNGGRGGYGWAQWTGPRRDSFENYATSHGFDPNSADANYGMLRQELLGEYAPVVESLRKAKSSTEAADIFTDQYLRPGLKASNVRRMSAQKAETMATVQPQPTSTQDLLDQWDALDQEEAASAKPAKNTYTVDQWKNMTLAQQNAARNQATPDDPLTLDMSRKLPGGAKRAVGHTTVPMPPAPAVQSPALGPVDPSVSDLPATTPGQGQPPALDLTKGASAAVQPHTIPNDVATAANNFYDTPTNFLSSLVPFGLGKATMATGAAVRDYVDGSAPDGFGQRYSDYREALDQAQRKYTQEEPYPAFLSGVTGSVIGDSGIVNAGMKAVNKLGAAGRFVAGQGGLLSRLTGGAVGGAEAGALDVGKTPDGMSLPTSMAVGAGLGGAGALVGSTVGGIVRRIIGNTTPNDAARAAAINAIDPNIAARPTQFTQSKQLRDMDTVTQAEKNPDQINAVQNLLARYLKVPDVPFGPQFPDRAKTIATADMAAAAPNITVHATPELVDALSKAQTIANDPASDLTDAERRTIVGTTQSVAKRFSNTTNGLVMPGEDYVDLTKADNALGSLKMSNKGAIGRQTQLIKDALDNALDATAQGTAPGSTIPQPQIADAFNTVKDARARYFVASRIEKTADAAGKYDGVLNPQTLEKNILAKGSPAYDRLIPDDLKAVASFGQRMPTPDQVKPVTGSALNRLGVALQGAGLFSSPALAYSGYPGLAAAAAGPALSAVAYPAIKSAAARKIIQMHGLEGVFNSGMPNLSPGLATNLAAGGVATANNAGAGTLPPQPNLLGSPAP